MALSTMGRQLVMNASNPKKLLDCSFTFNQTELTQVSLSVFLGKSSFKFP